MSDLLEVPNPDVSTDGSSSLTGSTPASSSSPLSTANAQNPFLPSQDEITLLVSPTVDSTIPAQDVTQKSTQFSPSDIDSLIVNCDLKSEDIPYLMAEKLPSSGSDDNLDSFSNQIVELESKNKETKLTTESEVEASSCSRTEGGKLMLDDSTMQSWLADGSDDSILNPCRDTMEEALINIDEESDMEEFGGINKNSKETTKSDTGKESVDKDLINLNDSQVDTVETSPHLKLKPGQSLLNIENEESENIKPQDTILDFEIETEKYARVYMEHFKNVLSRTFPLHGVKKVVSSTNSFQTELKNSGSGKGNGLKTVEEELQELQIDAEENFLNTTTPHSIAEIGLPKLKINDSLRKDTDAEPMRNIKKIGISSDKHQNVELDKKVDNEERHQENVDCSDVTLEIKVQGKMGKYSSDNIVSRTMISQGKVEIKVKNSKVDEHELDSDKIRLTMDSVSSESTEAETQPEILLEVSKQNEKGQTNQTYPKEKFNRSKESHVCGKEGRLGNGTHDSRASRTGIFKITGDTARL
ncbi:uncharacterized protein CDAR_498301 [Caerostris darwini]|uniref:Uncharacterized protein n=1 Tax=Caerostris darwini TaxID=1538125 RepID=A0AAV4U013_9ARAC|nr:uncharacterized protein CDAR_498301 [Caerostris darwini]